MNHDPLNHELQHNDLQNNAQPKHEVNNHEPLNSGSLKTEYAAEAFQFEVHAENVGIIFIDVSNEKVNTLKAEFVDQFAAILQRVQATPGLKGLVITSGKADSFIAGADISMIAQCKTKQDASSLAKAGQLLFEKLENYPLPIIAAIHGACLGGGLELALACHARICSLDDKTRLGLPEVQLGLLPGSGGTQRLPRLIGLANALDLMLTGRSIKAKQALKMRLVDDVVPQAILLETAIKQVQLGLKCRRPLAWQQRLLSHKLIANNVLNSVRKKALAKSKGHYPAIEKIIQVVGIGLEKGIQAGLQAEANAFGELAMTPVSAALRGLFFASTALKNESGSTAKAEKIAKVGILGGGLMGGGIAYVTAMRAQLPVRIKDINNQGITQALNYSWRLLTQRVNKKQLSHQQRERIMSRLSGSLEYSGLENSDIVIEAVFEDLGLKRKMLAEIETKSQKKTIFASNTSSLPIHQIASEAQHPERVIGLHYFSPVDKMPLVEVIPHATTDEQTIATVVALAKKQGKTAIVVGDSAGFYVNRILAPYLSEAANCLLAGESIHHIDQALVDFGFPVGPLNLLDEVGIDVCTKILPILVQQLGERFNAPEVLSIILNDQRQGRKNNRGFYLYPESASSQSLSKLMFWNKDRRLEDPSIYPLIGIKPLNKLSKIDIAERCVMLMLNESVRCLAEGVIRSPRDGDIGAVFGIGFPPFFGGPFRYIDSVGSCKVVETLQRLAQQWGDKFEPCDKLLHMAENNQKFYS